MFRRTDLWKQTIHIDASDIGFVRPGDPVALKIEPYNYLEHGYIEGHLRVLSADTFTTAGDGNDTPVRPYYKGYVSLDKVKLHDVPKDFALVHGMPVTADLKVGSETAIVLSFDWGVAKRRRVNA